MIVNMKYILFSGIILLVTSCMKEVDLDHLRPAPKLVLNCVVNEGQPLQATLTRTWFYSDGCPNSLLEDARIKLYANDRFVDQMTMDMDANNYNTFGNYVSSYIPVSGEKIRIEAEKDGFKAVMAEDIVPEKPALLNFSAEKLVSQDNNYYNPSIIYKITFQDEVSPGNCYLISFSHGYAGYEYEDGVPVLREYIWRREWMNYGTDPVFSDKISILDKVMGNDWLSGNGGRPFSDELFNGEKYVMKLKSYSSYGYWPDPTHERLPDSMRVYLYSISESYYKYLSALATLNDDSFNNDLAELGLAEPVRVFNNIEGGVGILGSACVDSLTVAIPEVD